MTATIYAQLSVPIATAKIVGFEASIPSDHITREDESYRLDLCLTPRILGARGCFRDRWGPHRFEPIRDLYLVPPRYDLHVRSQEGRESSIVCQLHPNPILEWVGSKIEWTDRQLEAILDISDSHIRSLLLRMAQEARHPGFASELLVEGIAFQLAIEIGRYCHQVETRLTGGLASWRLRLIDERLSELRRPPTLTELAALCNISVRQVTRGFRESRGCSIGDYVVQSRIRSAKRLLAGDDTVKGIARSLGFASHSSFSYAFRRVTGLTPGQFRTHVRRSAQGDRVSEDI